MKSAQLQLCIAVLVVLSVVPVCECINAKWSGKIPKGGFSKKARMDNARRNGEKYEDKYESSSTGTAGGWWGKSARRGKPFGPSGIGLAVLLGGLYILYNTGALNRFAAMVRGYNLNRITDKIMGKKTKKTRLSSARDRAQNENAAELDDATRRRRIHRYAKSET
eukprot:TRINITY_DN17858_c0_g2_i1.p1 TRINITY_DN17858_c0_g2~~TRINITY_DN17858_c0_g2_i1.p1  ORF type:complete len:184 (+),score=35.47 TRINITY_DN17858_c0_g2_i1:59-553(+)